MIRTAVIAALLIGVHAQAQAPRAIVLNVECEDTHVVAIDVQIGPFDRPKVLHFNISRTACGTPT